MGVWVSCCLQALPVLVSLLPVALSESIIEVCPRGAELDVQRSSGAFSTDPHHSVLLLYVPEENKNKDIKMISSKDLLPRPY